MPANPHSFRRNQPVRSMVLLFISLMTGFDCDFCAAQLSRQMTIREEPQRLVILINEQHVASYVFADEQIPRPYFCQVSAPDGTQVSRRHPPVPGEDSEDHATMHPGIWLAFGDLGGADFWRNRAAVRHTGFSHGPVAVDNTVSFTEQKHYVDADGAIVCTEEFQCSIRGDENAWQLHWVSTFHPGRNCVFGDQEEMGLGFRVATRLTEKNGGQLSDSEGRYGAAAIWGRSARWCDYGGTIDGRRAGMTLVCSPHNFRNSWLHARDYGLLVANPFGRKAMQQGDVSRIEVPAGESLRLEYGVFVYSFPAGFDVNAWVRPRADAMFLPEP